MTQKRSGYKITSIASLLLITNHSCAIQNLTENANSILIVKFRKAVSMAQDAIGLMLEDCEVCPKPSLSSAIHVDDGDFVAMIPFDMEEYVMRT